MLGFWIGFGLMGLLWFFRALYLEFHEKGPLYENVTSQIKVPAKWHPNVDLSIVQNGVATFELGLSPCGLEVTELYGSWSHPDKTNFTVKQKCADGSSKLFHYRREDLTGRIEESFLRRIYRRDR